MAAASQPPPGTAFPLSEALLQVVLEDRVSDRFVNELLWSHLGYLPQPEGTDWPAATTTPAYWREAFPTAPDFIRHRPPSIHLTRSIARSHKQLLKEQLGFAGYRLGELCPRRTRRATAVNWLLARLAERGEPLPLEGPLPPLRQPPADPSLGDDGVAVGN